jgi:hypothetical protein
METILGGYTRGVVPCPQPGATLMAAARAARVRFLVVRRYTSQMGPGVVRKRNVRVPGTTPGNAR